MASIARAKPREIIVVDGQSHDRTLEIARRYPVRVLSDEGQGLPVARLLGAQAARSRWVALIDADVILPDGALANLFAEFREGGYTALQAHLGELIIRLGESHGLAEDAAWRSVRAIVDDTVAPVLVYTVYFTDKIARYWRQP